MLDTAILAIATVLAIAGVGGLILDQVRAVRARPPVPGKHAARRGEEPPMPVFELRPANRPSEHPQLVTEDGVLELEL